MPPNIYWEAMHEDARFGFTAEVLLLIIASAETLIDKSLQGLQARLNDRLYKKQGHGGHWKMSELITLHFVFRWLEPFTGGVAIW